MSDVSPREYGPDRFGPRERTRLAVALLSAPVIMLVAATLAAIAERTGDDPSATSSLSSLFDLITPPTLIALAIAVYLVLHPWGRKTAMTAAGAVALQACGLSAVVGIEMLGDQLVNAGISKVTVEEATDNLAGSIPGAALMVMFLAMLLVGLIAMIVSTWRARWVPRLVPVLLGLFLLLDIGLPEHPKYLHAAAFALFLAACIALARAVMRTGAPGPVNNEQSRSIGQTVST